ncbi:hypothetical protein CWI75_04465 [Kineobactrum sediminis]|uniref:Alginate export domain-containing protein n=1 Tax=Kineobactrum sediminis TaxID=1905677 RepID=A0A2N5Y5F8_9GAMM|nr:alginate export family protein [Kineobactrum sediminis]PLW83609.1 hypothetical protein CWI75_04465 [Kineobactrum sediminis]
MKTFHRYLPCMAVAAALSTPSALAAESIAGAFADSDIKFKLRLRYEDVSQDGVSNSDALTNKTRLTFTSGRYGGFGMLLEADDITAISTVDYNDGTGINTGTAVIADPEGTEVNQAYLSYQGADTLVKYGRQRIVLDNQRFVGGVAWRQNEQTYDGFSVTNNGVDDLSVFYAYVHNVNRIFGEDIAAGDHTHSTHLLNAAFSGWEAGKLIAYGYLIDNESARALASDTVGVRWEGRINDQFSYNLEYAEQTDAGDNPNDYSADYVLLEAMAKVGTVNVKLGYELLGSDDGGTAFATPLATLHLFQGWADKFLATPAVGVEDIYLSVGTTLGAFKVGVVYHDLRADEGSMDLGSEIGFNVGTKVGPVSLLVKYADYSADGFATDTSKLWLMAEVTF